MKIDYKLLSIIFLLLIIITFLLDVRKDLQKDDIKYLNITNVTTPEYLLNNTADKFISGQNVYLCNIKENNCVSLVRV